MDLRRYQDLLRSMLSVFDSYCRQHQLRYSLCAGSLLGAVRHHGIIPWDDDIDVMMPRPDYDKLLNLASGHFVEGYKIIHAGNTPHYYLPLAKMTDLNTCMIEFRANMECPVGVNMDIFPVDAVPPKTDEQVRLHQQFRRLYQLASDTAEYAPYKSPFEPTGFRINNVLHVIKNRLYRIFMSSSRLFEKADKLIAATDWEPGVKCRIYPSYQYHEKLFDKQWFEEYVDMDFDGISVKCIAAYDKYLTTLFKNYMQLPPVEKRVCHHHHYFLDMDRGYTIEELKQKGIITY